AGHDRATGSSANKEFTERNELLELARIHPRAKEIGDETSAHRRAASRKREEDSIEPIAAELAGKSHPLRSVVGERTRPAMAVEIRKRIAGREVDVVVHR